MAVKWASRNKERQFVQPNWVFQTVELMNCWFHQINAVVVNGLPTDRIQTKYPLGKLIGQGNRTSNPATPRPMLPDRLPTYPNSPALRTEATMQCF